VTTAAPHAPPAATRGHVLVTGGAGYIGSLLCGVLLDEGWRVTVVDRLAFGGQSLLGYWHRDGFRLVTADVADDDVGACFTGVDAVVHLAAIVGFPACRAAGREAAWRTNVEATRRVFGLAEEAGVGRFVFSSTYSNYGLSTNGPVTEESPLHPQSHYAETKIAAEQFLLDQGRGARCAPLVFRFATLFGISPRTRFDLIVNQFVLEAVRNGELLIYQRGYSRAFVHVRDVVRGIVLALEAPEDRVRAQVYNLGSDEGNLTKDEIVARVRAHLPGTAVRYAERSFDGDMRDIVVSFAKVREQLGFRTRIGVDDGIVEVRDALRSGLIDDPTEVRYRNARSIVN
jgi:nucleoside-diphosphate-sugar epimerase